ncbi:hypothetical protein AgCh_032235 [Apium graveolens]
MSKHILAPDEDNPPDYRTSDPKCIRAKCEITPYSLIENNPLNMVTGLPKHTSRCLRPFSYEDNPQNYKTMPSTCFTGQKGPSQSAPCVGLESSGVLGEGINYIHFTNEDAPEVGNGAPGPRTKIFLHGAPPELPDSNKGFPSSSGMFRGRLRFRNTSSRLNLASEKVVPKMNVIEASSQREVRPSPPPMVVHVLPVPSPKQNSELSISQLATRELRDIDKSSEDMKTRYLEKPNSLIENSETSTSQINYGVLEISISQHTYRDVRMTNPLYIQILKNGPFTSMVIVEESTDGDMVIPAHYAPKDPSEYTEPEKEKVSLDSGLQLILIESLDNVMYNNIVNCDTAKQIWEKIEILCEGTEEVRSNQRRILISQYEGFMAKPKESITDVFERFNKLINDLKLHDKYYEAEEVNLKFLLTLPDHLEQKISAIREGRDLSRITLEVLYRILKIYELEMIQRKSLRSVQGHVVDGSSALIINESHISNDEPRSQTLATSTSEQRTNDSQEQVILELEEDEFYTLDELDELDQSMAYLARKFSNIRVKKPRFFKDHFATECRKPKKAKKDKAYLELETKYEALLKKQQSKSYIAEGKSWDDSDNDEDEEVGNYALMALEQRESSSSKSQVPTLTTIDLNMSQYKETVEKMST